MLVWLRKRKRRCGNIYQALDLAGKLAYCYNYEQPVDIILLYISNIICREIPYYNNKLITFRKQSYWKQF